MTFLADSSSGTAIMIVLICALCYFLRLGESLSVAEIATLLANPGHNHLATHQSVHTNLHFNQSIIIEEGHFTFFERSTDKCDGIGMLSILRLDRL